MAASLQIVPFCYIIEKKLQNFPIFGDSHGTNEIISIKRELFNYSIGQIAFWTRDRSECIWKR